MHKVLERLSFRLRERERRCGQAPRAAASDCKERGTFATILRRENYAVEYDLCHGETSWDKLSEEARTKELGKAKWFTRSSLHVHRNRVLELFPVGAAEPQKRPKKRVEALLSARGIAGYAAAMEALIRTLRRERSAHGKRFTSNHLVNFDPSGCYVNSSGKINVDKKYFYDKLDANGNRRDTGKDPFSIGSDGELEQMIKFIPIITCGGKRGPPTIIYTATAPKGNNKYMFKHVDLGDGTMGYWLVVATTKTLDRAFWKEWYHVALFPYLELLQGDVCSSEGGATSSPPPPKAKAQAHRGGRLTVTSAATLSRTMRRPPTPVPRHQA